MGQAHLLFGDAVREHGRLDPLEEVMPVALGGLGGRDGHAATGGLGEATQLRKNTPSACII